MRVTGLGAETARLNTLGGQWCVCLIRIAPSPGGVSATACPGGGSRHRPIRLDRAGWGGGMLVLGDSRAGQGWGEKFLYWVTLGRGGGGRGVLVLGDSRAGQGGEWLYWVTIGRGRGGGGLYWVTVGRGGGGWLYWVLALSDIRAGPGGGDACIG